MWRATESPSSTTATCFDSLKIFVVLCSTIWSIIVRGIVRVTSLIIPSLLSTVCVKAFSYVWRIMIWNKPFIKVESSNLLSLRVVEIRTYIFLEITGLKLTLSFHNMMLFAYWRRNVVYNQIIEKLFCNTEVMLNRHWVFLVIEYSIILHYITLKSSTYHDF